MRSIDHIRSAKLNPPLNQDSMQYWVIKDHGLDNSIFLCKLIFLKAARDRAQHLNVKFK